jgi:hypothetical protein
MRIIIVVLFLASIANAQSGEITDNPSAPVPMVSVYERYSAIHGGQEQEIMVVLCVAPPKLPFCQYWSRLRQADVVPLTFELNPEPGLAVHYHRKTKDDPTIKIGDNKVILLKVYSAANLRPGRYVLEGTLKFLQGDQGPGGAWAGNGVVREVPVRVPVMIAANDSKIAEADDWPTRKHVGRSIVQTSKVVFTAIGALALEGTICTLIDVCVFVPSNGVH